MSREALNRSDALEPAARLVQTIAGNERRTSGRVLGEARQDGLDHLWPAHGGDRPTVDRARRSRGRPARAATRGIDVRGGAHEPLAANGPNVRAGWLRLRGRSRA